MACVNVRTDRTSEPIKVSFSKRDTVAAVIKKTSRHIFTALTFIIPVSVCIDYVRSCLNVRTEIARDITVNIGVVCSISQSKDIEMWWCDGWRVLWNSKTKALWQRA